MFRLMGFSFKASAWERDFQTLSIHLPWYLKYYINTLCKHNWWFSLFLSSFWYCIHVIRRIVACVAGGIRERVSGGGAAISPLGISRAAKPRVKFPPATFRMVFACRPLLMKQLDKPIRERSVTWNLRFISARNDANARDSSEINPW